MAKRYWYIDSEVERDREEKGQDHCKDKGEVFNLKDLVVDGVMTSPEGGALTSPRIRVREKDGETRRWIFAVGLDNTMRLGVDGVRGSRSGKVVKHESLFNNKDVLAAGEIQFEDGIVVDVNDCSGTYRTGGKLDLDPEFGRAIYRALERDGVTLNEASMQKLGQ